jgi:hypothetical protein
MSTNGNRRIITGGWRLGKVARAAHMHLLWHSSFVTAALLYCIDFSRRHGLNYTLLLPCHRGSMALNFWSGTFLCCSWSL